MFASVIKKLIMKKNLLSFIAVILISTYCYSQIKYEKGYFIDNSGNKTECLIRNVDWKNNPSTFSYKINETSEEKENTIELVKEFGIYNFSKYYREIVNIDISSDNPDKLDDKRAPNFNKEKLFLKVLIEGKANLYSYKRDGLRRFFFNIDSDSIEQLIYKKYILSIEQKNNQTKRKHNYYGVKSSSGSLLKKNERYKQQLLKELECSNISLKQIESTNYSSSDLSTLFEKFNLCKNSTVTNFYKKKQKGAINFSLKLGARTTSMQLNYLANYYPEKIAFDNKLTYNVGFELEYLLPINRNKWSLFVEPTFHFYGNSEKTVQFNSLVERSLKAEVNYNSLELPLGIKHYLFLNDTSKFFISGAFVIDLSYDSYAKYKRIDDTILNKFDVKSNTNAKLGFGYVYKNKFIAEVSYQTERDLLYVHQSISLNHSTLSFTLGYKI